MGPFFAQAIYKSVIFTTNDIVNKHIFTGQKTTSTMFLSGAIAGSINAFIVSPIELIRTRLILNTSKLSNSNYPLTLKKLVLEEGGFIGLFRGLLPAICRDGPGIGAYLLTFDYSKRYLSSLRSNQFTKSTSSLLLSPSSTTSTSFSTSSSVTNNGNSLELFTPLLSPLAVKLISGSCAGLAFWTLALPIDTIKTIIEQNVIIDSNVIKQIQYIYGIIKNRGGFSILFRAWPVAIGRGIPSAAVTLTTFDLVSEWFDANRSNRWNSVEECRI